MQGERDPSGQAERIAGRYTLIDRIGAGGVGVVYRARDEVSGRTVAFKQLLSEKAGKRAKALGALFEREFHTLSRLKHPRIIEVYDYGIAVDGPYYTMELLEGRDLGQMRQLPYTEVCRHLRDVASSLALLHAQRLVHRDVSPRNVLLTSDGTARLLDFGAVTSFGTNSDVVGTPAFMAPEVVQFLPLDHRTDLYSLGAVGYFCLTGRPAFATQDVSELPRLWHTPLRPPSAFAPDVPAELDRLILSLLSHDPLGRPQTAADVIDELTVIGRLPAEPHERVELSYLLSSPMVGRSAQLDKVVARIKQALAGKGAEVLIEGSTGIGKTRLANEICLAGTLNGTATVRADAESTRSRFGVAVTLGLRMLEVCPEVARRTAEPHAAALRHLSPDLADVLGGVDSGTEQADAAERRMRGHSALLDWFLAVSRERTLLVSVDNVQAVDEDSAAFLAALGRESRGAHLLVVATARTGSSTATPDALKVLRERAHRIKLSGLDARSCELLASGLFGAAVNAGRVGNLLYTRSGGVPRQFIELAELMVQKKIAKYEGGGWVLPLDVADHELPARSEEIVAARLSGLGEDAISLGKTLAIHSGAVPLAIALTLSDLPSEARTHAALDELSAEQVLMREGDGYRFRHEVIRQALFSTLDSEARRQSQMRAAEVLLSSEMSGVGERVEAALHLIDAGEKHRGTRVLVSAARDFAAGAGTHHNPDPLVRALIRMVRTDDEQGRSDYELAALLFPLIPLAYHSASWQFILEYGARALDIGIRITGLKRAAELEPELGREAALKRGFAEAGAAIAAAAPDGIGYDLKGAIAASMGMVPACVAVYAACFDSDGISRIARAVAPLALLGEDHLGYAMHLFAVADSLIQGRESESRPLWDRVLARFEDGACANLVGKARAKALQGGTLFVFGVLDSYRFGEGALAVARRMDDLGVKTWAVTADQIRLLYHAFRGESAEVKRYTERLETNAIQGAQISQAEVFWPALLLKSDVLVGDAMAARRRCIQLERRSKELPTLKPQAEAARAAYLMLRGNISEAISLYEKLLQSFPIRRCVGWETTRSAFAKALNAAGAHERARAVASEVVSNMVAADEDYVGHFLEARRQLALAESGLGEHERAAASLDDLLAKYGDEDNPLLVGLLHQARAEVAERANDAAAAATHRAEMEMRFRRTHNPVLIAQCERGRRGTPGRSDRRKPREGNEALPNAPSTFSVGTVRTEPAWTTDPSRIIEALDAAEEPFETALEFLIQYTSAKSAYLYVRDDDELTLAWSTSSEGPPAACVAELEHWLDVANETEETPPGGNVLASRAVEAKADARYRLVALRNVAKGVRVGGVILEAESSVDFVGSSDFFDALGRVVEQRRTDTLGFVTA